jgi:hypothetical protein
VALSRFTYTGLRAHSGEAFGRVEHLSGFLLKGFVGGGAITTGRLQDEDFPPLILPINGIPTATPYSSTNSDQRDGGLAYATIDAGWTWRSETSKLGFIAGYNYFHQLVNVFGCTQIASNPFVCNPTIPASVLVITDEWNWNSIRLGFNGQWRFWGGFAFDLDFAWLPHAWLGASDTHWQRVPFLHRSREWWQQLFQRTNRRPPSLSICQRALAPDIGSSIPDSLRCSSMSQALAACRRRYRCTRNVGDHSSKRATSLESCDRVDIKDGGSW